MGTGPSPITPPVRCTVQADAEKTAFAPAGGSGTLRITTNRECAWSVTSQASWLSLTLPSEGQGEASVTFTVAANQDPTARSAGLAVNDREIRISQDPSPCQFTLSSMQETVDALGGDRTIRVASSSPQCEWTARSDEGWIEIVEGRQGRGPGAVTFRVGALSGDGRTGALSIAGVAVRVEQSRQPTGPVACQVSIAPVSFTFGASGGTGEVHVTAAAGCAWPVESLASWITVRNRSASSGPGIVTFQVAATDGPARAAFLKIGSSVATIDQSPGCAFTVSPSSHTAPASGGVIAITVTTAAGCSWTAASAAPWIATGEGGNAGTGNGSLNLTVTSNPGHERSGTVLVAGRSITVTQPSGCRYDVSPPNLDAAAGGGVPVDVGQPRAVADALDGSGDRARATAGDGDAKHRAGAHGDADRRRPDAEREPGIPVHVLVESLVIVVGRERRPWPGSRVRDGPVHVDRRDRRELDQPGRILDRQRKRLRQFLGGAERRSGPKRHRDDRRRPAHGVAGGQVAPAAPTPRRSRG